MASISYPCVRCGQRHDFDAGQAGAWVNCDGCDAAFQVPVPRALAAAAKAPASSPPKAGNVKFPCEFCKQRYEVSLDRVGHRFECRKCGATLIVPGSGMPANPAADLSGPTWPQPPAPGPLASRPEAPAPRPRPQAPGPAPAPMPLDFLDEPDAPPSRPGSRDDDLFAPSPGGGPVLSRRTPPPRRRSGPGLALVIGGAVGTVVLLMVAGLIAFAARSPLFATNPYAENEAKITSALNAFLVSGRQFGDALSRIRDVHSAEAALPQVGQTAMELARCKGVLDSYATTTISKRYKATSKAEFEPKFKAEEDRIERAVARIRVMSATLPDLQGRWQTAMGNPHQRLMSRFGNRGPLSLRSPQPAAPIFQPQPQPQIQAQPPIQPQSPLSRLNQLRRHGRD